MLRNKSPEIGIHLVAWVLFFALIIAFVQSGPEKEEREMIFAPTYLLFYFSYISLYYLNSNLLIPRLYLKKRLAAYFASLLILVSLFFLVRPFDNLHRRTAARQSNIILHPRPSGEHNDPPGRGHLQRGPQIDIISLVLFVMIILLGSAAQIVKQWRITEQRALMAEKEKANAELSFLKAQVNPHFLFNTLNNIYSMAVANNEHTAESIMKLSNIMRYITDEAGKNYVDLKSEVECIRDYVDLQRMRLSKKVDLDFNVAGNLQNKVIAPLILITYIENVFKYGISSHEPASITIKLSAEEKTITFFCQNKLFNGAPKLERAGTGIINARLRLEHLYEGKHLLNISQDNGLFTVHLVLIA